MFSAGQILYFQPFYFKNGADPKPKYFVILKVVGNETIVASLPTRTNNAPSLIDIVHGCINIAERMFNCYVFEKDRCVCDNGFAFDLHTYIYGDQIENYNASALTQNGSMQLNKDFKIEGELKKDEFEAIYKCVAESNATKNKIKKFLN